MTACLVGTVTNREVHNARTGNVSAAKTNAHSWVNVWRSPCTRRIKCVTDPRNPGRYMGEEKNGKCPPNAIRGKTVAFSTQCICGPGKCPNGDKWRYSGVTFPVGDTAMCGDGQPKFT